MNPTLLTIARRAFEGETALPPKSTLLLAVSGGPDSMALLHVAHKLAPKLKLDIVAHGVDHGLRPEAKKELDRAEELARALDVAWAQTTLAVAKGGNVQARAREARWAALAKVARRIGACAIATAHHADDRAETVILRILRGAGARGLAVMPPRAPVPAARGIEIVRPFLRARRADIRLHVERHALPFALDPSNDDPKYLRTRVRRDVLPLLEELDPGIVRHLEAIADDLAVSLEAHATHHNPQPYLLSRPTQGALVALARSRSKTARVWLPLGLVATYEEKRRPPEGSG
jgi:tRNA(Ile)-lysidine synthase